MLEKKTKKALVIGAGVGGLSAASVLSEFFEEVLIIERDILPNDSTNRNGVPQGKHLHALLAGGFYALNHLFPGFERDLIEAGAVELKLGYDIIYETGMRRPFPQRDLGLRCYSFSRPLLEGVIRNRVLNLENVHIITQCKVTELLLDNNNNSVIGLKCKHTDSSEKVYKGDLVVDASNNGKPTFSLLKSKNYEFPREEKVFIQQAYSTVILEIPDDFHEQWKGIKVSPRVLSNDLGAAMLPIENGRWILSVSGRKVRYPQKNFDGLLDDVKSLGMPTIYEAVKNAKRIGDVEFTKFNGYRLRHFEEMKFFPNRLLLIGDTICRFNPIYAQGMTVAIKEAVELKNLLKTIDFNSLNLITKPYYSKVSELLQAPWETSAIADFAYPETQGIRPANLDARLKRLSHINEMAEKNTQTRKILSEVLHLVKPFSYLNEIELDK